MHAFERDSLGNTNTLNPSQGKEITDQELNLIKDEKELTHDMEAKINYLRTPMEPEGEGANGGCMCACNGCKVEYSKGTEHMEEEIFKKTCDCKPETCSKKSKELHP